VGKDHEQGDLAVHQRSDRNRSRQSPRAPCSTRGTATGPGVAVPGNRRGANRTYHAPTRRLPGVRLEAQCQSSLWASGWMLIGLNGQPALG
jgi:hypothetical protein